MGKHTQQLSFTVIAALIMDKLINAGKDFLEEKVKGDNKDNNNNRQDYHAGGNQSHGGSYPAGGGFSRDDDDDENDLREAREEAERRAGSSGSSDLFSTIAGAIGQKKSSLQNEDPTRTMLSRSTSRT